MIEQVSIRIIPDEDPDDRCRYASLELYVNGEKIAEEQIGCEPEDNMWTRDYDWIAPTMKLLAERLGAEATVEINPED